MRDGVGLAVVGFLLSVVVACGGESSKNANGGDDTSGGEGGTSGAGDRGGAETGGAGENGASSGGACGRGGCILPTDDRDPIAPPGPVYCGGTECAESEVCCLSERVCYDPERDPEACPAPPLDNDAWGRKPCASNAHCGDKEFCNNEEDCSETGHCHPISNCGGCTSTTDGCRVCGCDGNTYPDQQTACLAQTSTVNVRSAACGETVTEGGSGVGGSGGSGGGGGGSGMERELTPCGHDAQCPDGELCCPLSHLCYAEDTPYLCEEPPAGTNAPCLTDEDCRAYEYCWGDGCDAPGGCVGVGDMADDCGITLEPVCGCDAISYTSAACADERAVRVAYEGECADEE